ncbi:MAG: hypothetical protein ACKO4A_00945 [Gammaproteobacteria bacterium]
MHINALRHAALALALLLSASVGFAQTPVERSYRFDFADGSRGWQGDFADYPAGEEEFYQLGWGFARLPSYLAANRFAMTLKGHNYSDDLSMFLRRRISGLAPDTEYTVHLRVTIASNAPEGAIGIGGPPGEGVVLKAGAMLERPFADPQTRLLNVDKGIQSNDGADAIVLGHIGVDTPLSRPAYKLKTLDNAEKSFVFRSDETGDAWLLIATDSGFEGATRIYVVSATFTFTPSP